MVLLHQKVGVLLPGSSKAAEGSHHPCSPMQRSDLEQFLFETTVEASVKDTIAELASVNNLRSRIQRLKLEGEELAKYGPAKLPDKQGIDEYSEEAIDKGQHYLMDPTGRRTGNGEAQERPWAYWLGPCADHAMFAWRLVDGWSHGYMAHCGNAVVCELVTHS